MSTLVIVESPAKAKTIANFLGKGYRVEASYGHVRDLPAGRKEVPEEFRKEAWADFAVNVDNNYEPIYIISAEKKRVIANLRAAMKDATELLLATDEDREGESISWHLLEVLKPPKNMTIRRIVFHEITREAIREAVSNPRDLDMDLVHAQEGRRIVDRLFGYKLSPVLWRKVQPGLSAGRVQSAAVRLLVEREEERRRFRTGQFWDLEATIGATPAPFKAALATLAGSRIASGKDFDPETGQIKKGSHARLLDGPTARGLEAALKQALPWTVRAVEDKPGEQRPAPPFTTSTLQQEAHRKLGFAAKRTMQIAQRLYEGVDIGEGERVGLITYMRTDSVSLSDKARSDAQQVIRRIYGADYAQGPRSYQTKTRNAQEAHEAIRPTEMSRRPQDVESYLEREELRLYELIWKRTMASQMPNAEVMRTSVEIAADAGRDGEAIFTASGKKILFPGYLRAYVEGSDDPAAELGDRETVLPDLQPGQKILPAGSKPLSLEALVARDHETQPPARYTEASLVKKLEEEGIGRPSTYATIIGTIQERGYCFANKQKQLVPTFTAMVVTTLLRDHFGSYVDLRFTARMEEELDSIASGDIPWERHVAEFYRGVNGSGGLEQLVDEKKETLGFVHIELGVDEDGRPVRVRVGRYGPYVACGENGEARMANIPKDTAPADLGVEKALELLRAKAEGPRCVGNDPATGQPVYAMNGRFGAYVQLGENPDDKKAPKPRRQSLDKGMDPETVDLATALRLLALPRELGNHPETGTTIIANNGRYGPYVQHDRDFRSLKAEDNVYTVTLERALEILAEPKAGRAARGSAAKAVLADLGTADGVHIQVLEGRYGAYVSDGTVNATLPKGTEPGAVTREQASELLAERAKSGGGAKKKPAAKTATKAPAKRAAATKKTKAATPRKPAAKKKA